MSARPNIILINGGDLGLGCCGSTLNRTLGIVGNERRPIGQVAQANTLTHYNPAHPYIIAEYDLADAG